MKYLVLLMIIGVTIVEFLAIGDKFGQYKVLPSILKFMPEYVSCLAALFVVAQGARTRFALVRPAYWILFVSFLLVIVCGIVANGVEAGPIFAGIRTYLRGLPWFFLAAVMPFKSEDLRVHLKWLVGIAAIQLPIAVQQRIRTGSGYFGHTAITGDWTVGTLLQSGVLSIFLVSIICIAVAFYERKQLAAWKFLAIFLVCLIPTTINETKVTAILMPIGVLVSFACAAERGRVLRRSLLAVAILGVAGAIFVPVYNALTAEREYSVPIGQFFTDPEAFGRYMSTGKEVGATGEVGRADAIKIPTKEIAKSPVTLMFGFGIGNASDSALGESFSGSYSKIFEPFLKSSYSRFVLEFGLSGICLLFLGYLLIWNDARAVAAADRGFMGAFAAGWVGVTVVIAITTFYLSIETFAPLGYLFWYFSGLLMAERMRRVTQTVPKGTARNALSPTLNPA